MPRRTAPPECRAFGAPTWPLPAPRLAVVAPVCCPTPAVGLRRHRTSSRAKQAQAQRAPDADRKPTTTASDPRRATTTRRSSPSHDATAEESADDAGSARGRGRQRSDALQGELARPGRRPLHRRRRTATRSSLDAADVPSSARAPKYSEAAADQDHDLIDDLTRRRGAARDPARGPRARRARRRPSHKASLDATRNELERTRTSSRAAAALRSRATSRPSSTRSRRSAAGRRSRAGARRVRAQQQAAHARQRRRHGGGGGGGGGRGDPASRSTRATSRAERRCRRPRSRTPDGADRQALPVRRRRPGLLRLLRASR